MTPSPHASEDAGEQRLGASTTHSKGLGSSRGWHPYVPIWAGGRVKATVALSCVSPHHGSFLRRGEGEELAA